MADEADNARPGTPNAEADPAPDPLRTQGAGPALRSTFGFDRNDEQWLATVRDAIAPAAASRLGAYTVLAEIGRGSQGAVFKAIQPGTQRIIAIKRLAAGAFAGPSARARFEREVETASSL